MKVLKQFYSISRNKTYKVGEQVSDPDPGWVKAGLVGEDKNGKPEEIEVKEKPKRGRKK